MSSSMNSGGNLAQSVAERLADQIQVLTKRHVVVFSSIYISSMLLFVFLLLRKTSPSMTTTGCYLLRYTLRRLFDRYLF